MCRGLNIYNQKKIALWFYSDFKDLTFKPVTCRKTITHLKARVYAKLNFR